ncbi:MAG: DUF1552 domain-containing protein [Myxococcota bacterium]
MAFSRRRFAAMLGGAALSAPLLSRLGRPARAQVPQGPVRFLGIRTPHGVDRDYWIPRRSDGSEPGDADVALSELTFDYDMGILQPLMGWRDQITILDGIDTQVTKEGTRPGRRTNHGHNEQGCLLTGAQPPQDREGNFDNHPSLDFFIHAQLPTPALLTAAVTGSGSWKAMSYDMSGQPRSPETNPQTVFRTAFPEDFVPPEPDETPMIDFGPGEARIMSFADRALQRMRLRVSGAEREKIDSHIAAMAALPGGGMGPGPGGMVGACMTRGTDLPGRNGNVSTYTDVAEVTRAHARVIAQAFACGRSRSATLQILNDFPNFFSDLPDVRTGGILGRYGDTFRFHENLVHDYWNASGSDKDTLRVGYLAGLRWSASHFAAVLEELDAITDPQDPTGGSILDNTIVFWHNEFGHDGHDRQETRHPTVIAGGGGRTLRLGRYLRLRNINSSERVPHNLLLTSIAQAVGLTDVDYYGDRDLVDRPEYRGPLVPLMV